MQATKAQSETARFVDWMTRNMGITMPYNLTADEICGGNISRIIAVECVIGGIVYRKYTPWAV